MGTIFILFSNYFGVYMPKIIDDAADELSNFLSVADHNNDELWKVGLNLVGLYMLFSLLKGLYLEAFKFILFQL